jgi:hypothetical protein
MKSTTLEEKGQQKLLVMKPQTALTGTLRGRSYRIVGLAIFSAALLGGCQQSQEGVAWIEPWQCSGTRNGVSYDYDCSDLTAGQDSHHPSWSEWEKINADSLAIAYECVTQNFDIDFDPYDFICKPTFSLNARKYDDGTAPRFHCYGSHDTDSDYAEFRCSPYWVDKAGFQKESGSGWFLWLALQRDGLERKLLLDVASDYQKRESEKANREISEMVKNPLTPEPTSNVSESLYQIQKWLKQSEQEESKRKSRSAAEVQKEIMTEINEWTSGHITAP